MWSVLKKKKKGCSGKDLYTVGWVMGRASTFISSDSFPEKMEEGDQEQQADLCSRIKWLLKWWPMYLFYYLCNICTLSK